MEFAEKNDTTNKEHKIVKKINLLDMLPAMMKPP